MNKYRTNLPQLGGALFLSDGGLETTLIFHNKVELPCFAAFDLLKTPAGRELLRDYYARYIAIARASNTGFILESNLAREFGLGEKLGYTDTALTAVNRDSILMNELRDAYESPSTPMVISGCVGPRFDGYARERIMSEDEAQAYHTAQIATFSATDADLVSAFTMTNVNEAIGVTRAAVACGMPVVISFTLEIDGRLPAGETLKDAIEAVDQATENAVLYYMINCVHPEHFEATLMAGEPGWCACAASAPMPPDGATPNSMRRPIWTREIQSNSGASTVLSRSGTTTSMCSAAAAAPITGMWSKSLLPARAPSDSPLIFH